jgi:hypothetical protein
VCMCVCYAVWGGGVRRSSGELAFLPPRRSNMRRVTTKPTHMHTHPHTNIQIMTHSNIYTHRPTHKSYTWLSASLVIRTTFPAPSSMRLKYREADRIARSFASFTDSLAFLGWDMKGYN